MVLSNRTQRRGVWCFQNEPNGGVYGVLSRTQRRGVCVVSVQRERSLTLSCQLRSYCTLPKSA
jgi:hypothetical protein